MSFLLAICIPTYNRRDILIPDVNRYLSIDDKRFCLRIQDNCSTDGTYTALSEISDSRLHLGRNDANLGPRINCWKALCGIDAEYVVLLLDKDTIIAERLVHFLDYLETRRPNYGYLALGINDAVFSYDIFKAGVDAVTNSAFLSKHPSGYFWRKPLLDRELSRSYFAAIPEDFDFPFEVVNGYLGVRYDADVVRIPLIVMANERNDYRQGKTYTYFGSNLFFGKQRRIETYTLYITSLLNLCLPDKEKETISYSLTLKVLHEVTDQLRAIYQDELYIEHYSLPQKVFSRVELYNNMMCVIRHYITLLSHSQRFSTLLFNSMKLFIKGIIWIK